MTSLIFRTNLIHVPWNERQETLREEQSGSENDRNTNLKEEPQQDEEDDEDDKEDNQDEDNKDIKEK